VTVPTGLDEGIDGEALAIGKTLVKLDLDL
jgi:hypothetical protein